MVIHAIYNEPELLEQLNEGSEDAFTAIYWHYSPQVYLKVFNMVKDEAFAEEIVQELFTRIWARKEKIDPAQNFSGLVNTIATNLILDLFRKIKKDRTLHHRLKIDMDDQYTNVEEALTYKENETILREAMNSLSPQQKKVYQLCRVEGFTYKDAAGMLGISHHTVKEYLVEANKSIRSFVLRHADQGLILWLSWMLRNLL